MTSEAYQDLGGGLSGTAIAARPAHVHNFHPESGWCGCGRRDTGEAAVGSPVWRVEQQAAHT